MNAAREPGPLSRGKSRPKISKVVGGREGGLAKTGAVRVSRR